MKKYLSLMLMLVLTLCFTACGNSGSGADDGQNPVMNYIGFYTCDRAEIQINAEGEENGASAIVTWASSATENTTWTMTGTFDSESKVFEYNNCVKINYVYNENGDVEDTTEVYNDGHGTMTFADGDEITVTWKDDKENVADGMVFTYDDGKISVPADGESE